MKQYGIAKKEGWGWFPVVRNVYYMWAFGDWYGKWKRLCDSQIGWRIHPINSALGSYTTKEEAEAMIIRYRKEKAIERDYVEPKITITIVKY